MLLRSSSTPVLGSLLPSHSESPGHGHHDTAGKLSQTAAFGHSQYHHKPSFHGPTFSCSSSPISPSVVDSSRRGFRRAQSEGNLEELVGSDTNEEDRFSEMHEARKIGSVRPRTCSVLQTIPSFSFYGLRGEYEDEEDEEEEEESEIGEGEDRDEFEEDSGIGKPRMSLHKGVMDVGGGIGSLALEDSEMFLAKGLGIGIGQFGGGGGGSGGRTWIGGGGGGDGRENRGVEEYYKRMVEENPNNPLFLRNYAQFLHQNKGESERAEEYYSRAILADPGDGELLSQYAKLVWEIHRDRDRALGYFERAAQASPEDSHIHAAYAGFLWETEDEGGEDEDLSSGSYTIAEPGACHEGLVALGGS